MKDPQQRLRALSREKQSLLVMWLRAERGATVPPPAHEAARLPSQELASEAKRLPVNLPSPEELEGLSNEEVDSLLGEMLASASSAHLASLIPGANAGSMGSTNLVPDTNSMSDDEVAAMLAEILQQEETR